MESGAVRFNVYGYVTSSIEIVVINVRIMCGLGLNVNYNVYDYMVTSIITGMKTFETPLVTCRIGVPESRVDRINLTTRVSIALPLIPAV